MPDAYQASAPASGADVVATIIPYRNKPALIGYYLGVFSLIPLLGLLCAIPAIPLGIIGLRKRAAHPEAKGLAHALVALIMGILFTVVWGGLIVVMYLSAQH